MNEHVKSNSNPEAARAFARLLSRAPLIAAPLVGVSLYTAVSPTIAQAQEVNDGQCKVQVNVEKDKSYEVYIPCNTVRQDREELEDLQNPSRTPITNNTPTQTQDLYDKYQSEKSQREGLQSLILALGGLVVVFSISGIVQDWINRR